MVALRSPLNRRLSLLSQSRSKPKQHLQRELFIVIAIPVMTEAFF